MCVACWPLFYTISTIQQRAQSPILVQQYPYFTKCIFTIRKGLQTQDVYMHSLRKYEWILSSIRFWISGITIYFSVSLLVIYSEQHYNSFSKMTYNISHEKHIPFCVILQQWNLVHLFICLINEKYVLVFTISGSKHIFHKKHTHSSCLGLIM